jgi:hypothetical protein
MPGHFEVGCDGLDSILGKADYLRHESYRRQISCLSSQVEALKEENREFTLDELIDCFVVL